MSNKNISRPLNDKGLIEQFLSKTLGFDKFNENVVSKINQIENLIDTYEKKGQYKNNTFHSEDVRDAKYREEKLRWKLRDKINKELLTLKRLDDDEKIKLGKGGALPSSNLKNKKEAVIIIGLPASGKSGLSNAIADLTGSLIIDSDYAKRKLPEFKSEKYLGAYHVHKESSVIVFGNETSHSMGFKPLIEQCCDAKNNIVLPRIGADLADIYDIAVILNEKWKYKVHLVLINLDRKVATVRALQRFLKTDRYIPLGRIFDTYCNECQLTYYRLKNFPQFNKYFDSFAIIDTNVEEGNKYNILELTQNSPLNKIAGKYGKTGSI
ncbi:MAG: zeta toxin family protein [Sphingobacteriales bacterium]|nr:MAG: zeta toxin family protein [Sphingobacteriales bacterium]